MGGKDIGLAIFFLIFFLISSLIFQMSVIGKEKENKYFTYGLMAKMVGAIFAAVIYVYYYGDGDSLYYFRRAIFLRDLLDANFSENWKVFFSASYKDEANVIIYKNILKSDIISYFTVVQITTVLTYLGFKSFIGVSMLFGLFSYFGNWLMYKTFCKIYPTLYKQFAIAVLFLPGAIFWGSGLFKDTITFSALGYIFWGFYNIFFLKKHIFTSVGFILIAVYFIAIIKAYIIIVFIPFLVLWKILHVRSAIKSTFIRTFVTPIFLVITLGISYPIINQASSLDARFSLNQLDDRAKDMIWWHSYAAEVYGDEGNGSAYSLGSNDLSGFGLIKKIPLAINVTFFRPYIFEVRGLTMLLGSIESTFFLYFFLKVFFKLKKAKRISGRSTIKEVFSNHNLTFIFGFAIMFGMGVGMTSYNFGALARYKIPAMPFFLSGLFIVNEYAKSLIEGKNRFVLKK